MHRASRLFAIILLTSLGFIMSSCETETQPRGPADDVSGLPWNCQMPGDRTGGGMPFQSH